MAENVQDKAPAPIILTPVPAETPKTCHRFFAPVVFPEPDRLNPKQVNITPRLGSFPCIGSRCTLWNPDGPSGGECWDVSAARGQSQSGQYAYNKMNDVMIESPQGH